MNDSHASFASLLFASTLLAAPAARADSPAAAPPPVEAPAPLRVHRVAFGAFASHAFVPGSLSHQAIGGTLEWYPLDALGLGIGASLHQPLNAAADAASPARWPLNEVSATGALRVTFVIVRAREGAAVPDVYLVGGPGVVSSRPVAENDAQRTYSFHSKLALAQGVGARFYFGRTLAVGIELRDTFYVEALEAPAPAPGQRLAAQSPLGWYGETRPTHMIEAQLGLTVFLPSR